MRPPVIDGIEELDFLESGMPSSRLGCPLSLKTPNMGNTGEVVARFDLRPVETPQAPELITEDDLGAVCYQVVLRDRVLWLFTA